MSTNEGLRKSLEGHIFFIDRSSGKAIKEVFEKLGLSFELHDTNFPQETQDVEWLEKCGAQKWWVISSNRKIQNNAVERKALFNAKVGAFFFTSADFNTREKLEALTKALPRIASLVLSEPRPFIARISKDGTIELWINHKQKEVRKRIKVKKFGSL